MTQYDPKVIYKYAAGLYSRAQTLVLAYGVAGLLLGGGMGKIYSAYTTFTSAPPSLSVWNALTGAPAVQPSPPPSNWTLIGALVCGLAGLWIGWNKAFALKLQAQTALCQMKIEENTRRG